MGTPIPDKLYFKIGEVAELTGVKPHVLRYWEAEFGAFRPQKSRSQQRLYRRKDIELVLQVKDLLYNQGYTIAGARRKLRETGARIEGQLKLPLSVEQERSLLREVREELRRLRLSLDHPRTN